jgi:uncharacterized cupin superfamily protein
MYGCTAPASTPISAKIATPVSGAPWLAPGDRRREAGRRVECAVWSKTRGRQTMVVYYGVVRGRVIELPAEAELAEGSVVEVRPTGLDPAEVEADRQFQEVLVAAGLLKEIRVLGARSPLPDLPPLVIDGPPVSQTIIDERR